MRVLVIDDDNFARSVYESELHQQNIKVELAKDGEDGLKKAKEFKPDLIITELILIKKNGFQVIEELRADPELKEIPIIVCSMLNQKSDIDEAMRLGADKFLSKEDHSLNQVVKEAINLLMK